MKHLFVFNPRALPEGKERNSLLSKIKEKCKGEESEIYFSSSSKDAQNKVRTECAKGEPICVYAGGGDGSLRQIAQAMYGYKNAVLSAIPLGTGNDFVRNFGGKDAFLTLDHISDGKESEIDLIQAGEYICINMINMGFDESVVTRVDKLRKFPLMSHSIAYTIGVVLQLLQYPKEHLHITYDNGESYTDPFMLTYIANGKYYGGGYQAASKASLDDGLMDTMTVRPLSRLTFIRLVGMYQKGTLLDNPKHTHLYRFSKNRSMTLQKDTPFRICIDGEIFTAEDLEIKILPKAIRFKHP